MKTGWDVVLLTCLSVVAQIVFLISWFFFFFPKREMFLQPRLNCTGPLRVNEDDEVHCVLF